MEEAKVLDFKITELHADIQEIKSVIKKISESMTIVSNQSIQIQMIQKAQQEHHEDIAEMRKLINSVANWQAGCPRASIDRIWWTIAGIAGSFGMMFLYHVFATVPK